MTEFQGDFFLRNKKSKMFFNVQEIVCIFFLLQPGKKAPSDFCKQRFNHSINSILVIVNTLTLKPEVSLHALR